MSMLNMAGDPLLDRLQSQMKKIESIEPGFSEDLALLVKRYDKLTSRLDKIIAISDGYQAQLREVTARMDIIAHTDILTGLSNRRAMMEQLENELARAQRYEGAFSLAIFDADDFKRVNDTYGHDAGDEVLKLIASEFKATLRRSDSCARWGGEEFLVLFPTTEAEAAYAASEKCRLAIAHAKIKSETQTLGITLSAGVSTYSQGMDLDSLLKKADSALYRAKAEGKNRVVLAS